MMLCRIRPTETTESVRTIDYDHLYASGKRALIFDLDNTLARRGTKQLNASILAFLELLGDKGFQVGILTNRRRNADDPIVHSLRKWVPVVSKAGKPSRRGYRKILALLDASPQASVMIGDRWFTDCLGAVRMGMHSIRVRSV